MNQISRILGLGILCACISSLSLGAMVYSPLGSIELYTALPSQGIVISYNGNIGLGTSNPTERLSVVGNGMFTGSVTANTLFGTHTGTWAGGIIGFGYLNSAVVTNSYTGGVSINGVLSANTLYGTHTGTWAGAPIGTGSLSPSIVTNNYNGSVSINGVLSANTLYGTYTGTWAGGIIGLAYMNTSVVTTNFNGNVSINGIVSVSSLEVLGRADVGGVSTNGTVSANKFVGDGSGVLNIGAAKIKQNRVIKAAAYTVTAADSLIMVSNAGAAYTITLPNPNTMTDQMVTIKKTDANNNWINVTAPSGFDGTGYATTPLMAQGDSVSIMSDGTNWLIVSRR